MRTTALELTNLLKNDPPPYLSVKVESVQVLSLLISLVAIVSFDLALVAVFLRVEFSDVQRILEVIQIVSESERANQLELLTLIGKAEEKSTPN